MTVSERYTRNQLQGVSPVPVHERGKLVGKLDAAAMRRPCLHARALPDACRRERRERSRKGVINPFREGTALGSMAYAGRAGQQERQWLLHSERPSAGHNADTANALLVFYECCEPSSAVTASSPNGRRAIALFERETCTIIKCSEAFRELLGIDCDLAPPFGFSQLKALGALLSAVAQERSKDRGGVTSVGLTTTPTTKTTTVDSAAIATTATPPTAHHLQLTCVPLTDDHDHELWLLHQVSRPSTATVAFIDETKSIPLSIVDDRQQQQRQRRPKKAWQEKVTTIRNFHSRKQRRVSTLLEFEPAPSPYVYSRIT